MGQKEGMIYMGKSLILILLSIGLAVAGQIYLKIGMTQVGAIDSESLILWKETLVKVFGMFHVWFGLILYGLSAISWLVVLSRVDLSFAYPFAALGYVAVVLVSPLFLREVVSPLRWMGVLTICLGVIMVARS